MQDDIPGYKTAALLMSKSTLSVFFPTSLTAFYAQSIQLVLFDFVMSECDRTLEKYYAKGCMVVISYLDRVLIFDIGVYDEEGCRVSLL